MPASVLLDVGPAQLSGLLAEPSGAPRGLIVALHGGGARAAYFDSPVDPASSLIRLAAAAGWRAVALDRPGYGASAALAASRLRVADQVPLIARATAQLRPDACPVLLVGHSLGALVAVHAAALEALPGLVALAIGGIPLRYTADQTERLALINTAGAHIGRPDGPPPAPADWFGPAGSWDPRLVDHRPDLVTRTPSAEFLDARDCPDLLPPVLGQVRCAVQVAAAEHELTTASATEVLAEARAALVRARSVETLLLKGSGHNLSLGTGARAYHLRVLAFAEEAVAP
ncbi:MAG: alpha/beta fold hydrolase [Mycobacteriales bacterium]